jgi:amino acid transporter
VNCSSNIAIAEFNGLSFFLPFSLLFFGISPTRKKRKRERKKKRPFYSAMVIMNRILHPLKIVAIVSSKVGPSGRQNTDYKFITNSSFRLFSDAKKKKIL